MSINPKTGRGYMFDTGRCMVCNKWTDNTDIRQPAKEYTYCERCNLYVLFVNKKYHSDDWHGPGITYPGGCK